jgi:glycolate oxidase
VILSSIILFILMVNQTIITHDQEKIIPHSPEEFSAIFNEASFKRLKLAIRGFNTQGSKPPGRIEISTLHLNTITEGYPGDLIVIAGTGTPFLKLKPYITDLPYYSGSIGGFLCGSEIPTIDRLKLTSRILKLTYIRPTGEIIELGSHSVKDVAGFRIAPLLFGSQGKLGLIAKVAINIAPMFRGYESYPVKSFRTDDNPKENDKFFHRILEHLDPNGILN